MSSLSIDTTDITNIGNHGGNNNSVSFVSSDRGSTVLIPEIHEAIPNQEETDPSLIDGYQVIYDREIPFEIRIGEGIQNRSNRPMSSSSQSQRQTLIDNLRVKLLIQGDPTNPSAYKIELSNESNLFFHYTSVCLSHEFSSLQYEQKLMVEFRDYSTVLIRLFNACLNEPSTHIALLLLKGGKIQTTENNEPETLIFIKNMEYKLMDLLTLKFYKTNDYVLQHHVVYRYFLMKRKASQLQDQLNEVFQLIKLKNPSLLLQIQKNPIKSANNLSIMLKNRTADIQCPISDHSNTTSTKNAMAKFKH